MATNESMIPGFPVAPSSANVTFPGCTTKLTISKDSRSAFSIRMHPNRTSGTRHDSLRMNCSLDMFASTFQDQVSASDTTEIRSGVFGSFFYNFLSSDTTGHSTMHDLTAPNRRAGLAQLSQIRDGHLPSANKKNLAAMQLRGFCDSASNSA